MDFEKIHGKSFENQLVRMTDRFPNFVFLSTKIGCVQLNSITLSRNTPLSADECLARIWESNSSFLGLVGRSGCECFFLKFLLFIHLPHLHYLHSTMCIFWVPTLQILHGGWGKGFKQKQSSAIWHGCVRCLTSCLLATGHLVVTEPSALLRIQQSTWPQEAIAPYCLVESVEQRIWV